MRALLFLLVYTISFKASAQTLNGDPPLITAVKAGEINTIEQIITKGAAINETDSNGATALLWAAGLGDLQIVKCLVKNGATVNISGVIYTNSEKTGYFGNLTGIAASQGHTEILKFLIDSCNIPVDDKEYNPETKQKEGWTALQWAAAAGKIDAVEYLLRKGADINVNHTSDKGTPLFYTVQGGYLQTAELLINKGADVNKANDNNSTPLMAAVDANNLALCILLWKNKADLNAKNKEGMTAIDIALDNENTKLTDFLRHPEQYLEIINHEYWKDSNDSLVACYKRQDYECAYKWAKKGTINAKNEFGTRHRNYTTSLANYTAVLVKLGKQAEAIPIYQELGLLLKTLFGEKDPDYLSCVNNLGNAYYLLGNFDNAETCYIEARDLAKQLYGDNNAEYATHLNNLANLYSEKGQYTNVEELYLKVIKIRKEKLGAEDPDYADALYDLANFYERTGQYTKAEETGLISLAIKKKVFGENHLEYAAGLNNLGSIASSLGQFEKAEKLYNESLEIKRRLSGVFNRAYVTTLNNLGQLYHMTAQFEKSRNVYLQALEIRKTIVGENHPDYANTLHNLASLYKITGQYEKAEPMFLQAAEIFNKTLGDEHPSYISSLNSLAGLYFDIGQYEKTEKLYKEVLAVRRSVLGNEHIDYAISLNNLAAFYQNSNQYKQAIELYSESKQVIEKAVGKKTPEYSKVLQNLAGVFTEQKDFNRAEENYLQSNKILEELYGKNHPDYAEGIHYTGVMYKSKGEYKRAESFYQQAVDIYFKSLGSNNSRYLLSLGNLAFLYMRTGKERKAEPVLLEKAAIEMQRLLSAFSFLSEDEKGRYLENNFFLTHSNNSFLYNYRNASPAFYKSNYNLQLVLKSLSLMSTKGTIDAVRNSQDSVLKQSFYKWQSNKSELAKQYSKPILLRRADLKKVEIETENLEKELTRKADAFKDQQQRLQIKTSQTYKGLGKSEAAVEFVKFSLFRGEWTDSVMYVAYILTPKDSIPIFVPLFEEKQLQQLFDSAGTTANAMVSKFYRGLELGNTGTAASLGKDLYNLVWAPLEPYLKGIKTISYSPAGKLYSIAFHALPVDSNTLLMDKYQLNQYTSTRQIALRKPEQATNAIQSITLFGDAAFTLDSTAIAKSKRENNTVSNIYTPQNRGNRGGSWTDLPGTAEEVKKIKQLFQENGISTKAFTQTAASEENLKALSGNSPQILHIATHGFFLPEPDKKRKENFSSTDNTYTLADDPLLRSGLILSGGNYAWSGKTPIEGAEDGIATAYEVSQLNLSNTELVVLSACETALGDVKGSEGVFGLQRAFKMAGVKKMIVSLWQVPDKETAELMTSFYNYWLKGKTIEQSFTQAQAEMRKKYSPYYWAAFVLVE